MSEDYASPELEVLIVAYGLSGSLERSLEPLCRRHRVTVVDNSSLAETKSLVEGLGCIYMDAGENVGFARAVNIGLAIRRLGVDVLLLNPDARIDLESVDRLRAELLAQPRAACAAPSQHAPGSSVLDRVCWPFPSPVRAWYDAFGIGRSVDKCDFVIGSVLLLRSAAIDDVGTFDERYFLYAEEADWQLRARRRGWSVLYCEDVEAEHIGAGTGGSRVEREILFHASHERFVRKWYGDAGWHVARLGVLAGATLRGLVRRGSRGRDDLRRARIYLEGPVRALERGAMKRLDRGSAAEIEVDTGRRLKVAHVVCADEFAGVERYVVTIASGLARQGCDVTVVGGHPGQMASGLRPDGVQWYPGATVAIALARLVRLGRFDIVHAHMSQAELVAALSLPVTRSKIVTTRHFARRRGSSGSARALAALAPVVVGEQLAISEYVAQSIDGSSVVVRPGVADVADPTPLDARERVVLVLQRLAPEKHTEVGIDSFARSGLAALGWQLEIAGTGEMESDLRERADRLGLGESCQFLGQRFDVDALYRRASIFLATRPDEPYGLSVLEAMSYGLPVVAPRGGGHVETVGIAAGATLFTPGDLDAAASMLEGLATDPAVRAEYGGELRRIQQEHFTIATQVDATLAVYRRLVT